ncbi:TPA: hypothetical protein ACH3X1_001588 [Trebouxia sp. C0004]
MHTPRGEAQKARVFLQSIYDRHLRHICGVKYATPSAMLLEELGLSPLPVFWWQQTLEFWNKIAASHVGSLFHTILLDNLDDACSVGNGANNFSCSIATCLQSVGQPMPLDSGTIPVLEVGTIVEALRQHLGGTLDYALHCQQPLLLGLLHAHTTIGKPFSQHRRYCQLPVSGRRMQRFLQFRLGSHQLPIDLGRFGGGQHVAKPIGSAHIVVVWLLQMNCT